MEWMRVSSTTSGMGKMTFLEPFVTLTEARIMNPDTWT